MKLKRLLLLIPTRVMGLILLACLSISLVSPVVAQAPAIDASVVFAESDGLIAVEAEHFFKQTEAEVRAFHLTHLELTPDIKPDGDPPHVGGASGGAYLEILPDSRRNHGEQLIKGTNFSPEPGKLAVLHYNVDIATPGKYYVWVRAHSTGSEDNGLHVGIDGEWPATGQRLQWCQGKQQWRWESKQRTEKQHCGEPYKIFLQIDEPGRHVIHFSMREDGFEFDKWLMTTDRDFKRPEGVGPKSIVKTGTAPESFPFVAAPPKPAVATPTPDPASSKKEPAKKAPLAQTGKRALLDMPAAMFADGKMEKYYVDQGKWLAVNPEENKSGNASRTFPYPTGKYHLTLRAVGENDGQSSYSVFVDGEKVGDFTCPLSDEMFEQGAKFNKQWKNVAITEGAIIKVTSSIGSKDGDEYSRARWHSVAFQPADEATKTQVAPILAKMSNAKPVAASSVKTSPTKPVSSDPLQMPRGANGDGDVTVTGELKQWHRVTLNLAGPYAHEKDNAPNPFTDHAMNVSFTHSDGTTMTVPGFFAADGNAANSGAEYGNVWRAHFAPSKAGDWSYKVSFVTGKHAALDEDAKSTAVVPFDGVAGTFQVLDSDKTGADLRGHGQLKYVGKHYLQFAGSKKYFLKVGADAPETFLAYKDFDNTIAGKAKKAPLKSWSAHEGDWNSGDPTWGNGRGKGMIGAINYLSGKGCNAFSFLTYNAGGDGDNVWPFIHRDDKMHYDCSKLDQWSIVFDHGTARGMYLHFKMQETEMDDHRRGKGDSKGRVPECLDGGNLGPQRKLYCRELIARFGHNLALNWNLGEENTQSTEQQQDMINYISELDAYDHNIVIHTFPGQQDKIYGALLGDKSKLTGTSLQNSSLETTHAQTFKWVSESAKAGRPWVVAFDESGSASHAQCPDLGYNGFDGHDRTGKMVYTQHKVRKQTLWGTLMAGGAGNEYYFGYQFDQNDIVCEDWRSRDQSWDYCRIAIEFFHDNAIPFWEMKTMDELVGNPDHGVSKFCFAKANDTYLVYLPNGGSSTLDLSDCDGKFSVHWFNPRIGGDLTSGSVQAVPGGGTVDLGEAPTEAKAPSKEESDWLIVVRRTAS